MGAAPPPPFDVVAVTAADELLACDDALVVAAVDPPAAGDVPLDEQPDDLAKDAARMHPVRAAMTVRLPSSAAAHIRTPATGW